MSGILCINIKNERGKFSEMFQLNDGEEIIVKAFMGASLNKYRITLEWNSFSTFLIRTRVYSNPGEIVFQKTLVINNDRRALFTFIPPRSTCKLLIEINRCKYFENSEQGLPSANDKEPTDVMPTIKDPEPGEELVYLSKDLGSLLRSGVLSDIAISDGTQEIRAHKLILSARSPVFARMLQHEMRETLENIITIEDTPMDVLKKLVDFIYSGRVEVSDIKTACSLYEAGDKYDIKSLKEVCSKMLMAKVDMDNVLQIIILADLHKDEQLKQVALDFIHVHYSQLKHFESWGEFVGENQALEIEILRYILTRKE